MRQLCLLLCFAFFTASVSGCKDKKSKDDLASEEIIDTKKKKKKSRFKSVQGSFGD